MMRLSEISVIILAAGFSERMGDFKPMMKLGGQTVLQRTLSLYREAGITDIRIVVGHRAEALKAAIPPGIATPVLNPAYASGMFSSVLAGVKSLPPNVRCFFVHPVDIPLVRPHTLSVLMAAFETHRPAVAYPAFAGTRGHPPLIAATLIEAITSHQGVGGLQAMLQHFDSRALDIQVADEGILLDMDTLPHWRQLTTRLAGAQILTDAECRVLMHDIQQLPEGVSAHCRQVAVVADALAQALAAHVPDIDVALVRSAAMVHDLAKCSQHHAAAGADLLHRMGFPEMAAVVATHMDIDTTDDSPVDNAQVVHLADKLVSGASVVRLQQRFQAKLRKYGRDPRAAADIDRRRRTAATIQYKIERISGMTIERILTDAGVFARE